MPLGVRTVVLGLLNGEQGVPMGGAPHVYLRRVGNGLMYCMVGLSETYLSMEGFEWLKVWL